VRRLFGRPLVCPEHANLRWYDVNSVLYWDRRLVKHMCLPHFIDAMLECLKGRECHTRVFTENGHPILTMEKFRH